MLKDKPGGQAVAVYFKIQGTGWLDGHETEKFQEEMRYKAPDKWRTELNHASDWGEEWVCDGSTAWYIVWFAGHGGQGVWGKAYRWDVAALMKELGRERTMYWLLDVAQDKVLIANPTIAPWSDETACRRELSKDLKQTGEERVGDTESSRFDKSGCAFWFGKEDALLRRQVVFDSHDKTLEVIEVEPNADIADDAFRYEPPQGITVMDQTRGLIDWLWEHDATLAQEQARGRWTYSLATLLVALAFVGGWLVIRRVRRRRTTR